MLNNVSIIGRLVRDPELKQTQGGTMLCTLSIANNRHYTANGEKREEVSFFDVTVWGRVAENANTYLKKGSLVGITGSLKQQTWDDKTTGGKRSKVTINAMTVDFLSTPKGDGQERAEETSPPVGGGSLPEDGDDIPFRSPRRRWDYT